MNNASFKFQIYSSVMRVHAGCDQFIVMHKINNHRTAIIHNISFKYPSDLYDFGRLFITPTYTQDFMFILKFYHVFLTHVVFEEL